MELLTTFSASRYRISDLQLFDGVSDGNAVEVLADCAVTKIAAGQMVPSQSTQGAHLYIVLHGALSVTQTTAQMGVADQAMVKVLPGECVGELSVLDDETNTATITALQDTELLVIEARRLWQLIDNSNGVARNLLRLLSFRIRAANVQIRRKQKVGEFYRQLSMLDGLTGLQNRAWLNDHFPDLLENAHALNNPLSIIMIDIDFFKLFNDQHGHVAGDSALKVAAKALTDTLRPRDFAARYGGEEMIVILPNTNQQAGAIVAQRLCERMQQSVVFADMRKPLPHITASFGLATLMPGEDTETLISRADAALYRAKEAGRNQVAM